MPFTLIKGKFYVVGKSPDGDSLIFKANRKTDWNKLSGRKPAFKSNNEVQLRYEAVDTLESHYHNNHQPWDLAHQATMFNLKKAGFGDVVWTPSYREVQSVRQDGLPGYILSRTTERYGRPVSFVYAGTTNKTSGNAYHLGVNWMRQSINYRLMAAGLAFPTYYTGLFHDLRQAVTSAAITAWNTNKGHWPYDWTNFGVPIGSLTSVIDSHVVMPKLFRRIVDHISKHGSISGFKQAMEVKAENIMIISTGHFTHFDTVIEQKGNKVRLTVWPEDLIFLD